MPDEPFPVGSLDEISDEQLLSELVRAGGELLVSGQHRLAALGDVLDDPRWGAPIPIKYEAQLPVLFLGALDAFDATAGLLRSRASQQAFHTLRFQIESIALIRWVSEPAAAAERQHRAYRVACGQIGRFGRFLMRDAGRNREALDGVRAVRDWGRVLRDIAQQDGISSLKRAPDAIDMFKGLRDVAEYANFSMYSELGSHPGAAGNTWFAVNSDKNKIRYDLGGSHRARAFLVMTSIFYLWKSFEATSKALAWDEWLQTEARPVYYRLLPLLDETLRRRKAAAPD